MKKEHHVKFTRSTLDYFLNNFSYSSKMIFILLVGAFAVVTMSLMMFSLQNPLSRLFQQQVIGLKYHEDLVSLLSKISKTEIFLIQFESNENDELYQLLNDLEMDFNKIKSNPHYMKTLVGREEASSENSPHIPLLINDAIEHWEKLKKEIKSSYTKKNTHLLALLKNIVDMIDENIEEYHLDQNLDRISYFMVNSFVFHVPHSQALITKILTKIAQQSKSIDSNAALIEEKEALKAHMIAMKENIIGIFQDQNTLTNEGIRLKTPLLLEYQKSIDHFLTLIESPNFENSLENVLEIGEKTWKLGNNLGEPSVEFINKHIQSFLNAIQIRQRASLIFILLAALAILLMFSRRIIRKPLENLKIAAQELETGNLAIRVPVIANDEVTMITVAFNKMAAFFEKTMFNAKQITIQLVETTSQILNIAKQLESNVNIQEKALHQLSLKAKGISVTAQNFNASLKEVNKIAGTTFRLAALGQSSLKEMENIMQQMGEASKNIVTSLGNLKSHIVKINSVITTILKIADQSNLLSLNTAIKASKTGIKGIGFAVVAEKIRELADQTADTTLDIEQAVQGIVSVVSDALVEVDKFSLEILAQVEDEKSFNDQLKKLIVNNQEQMKNFETINLGIEDQFKESIQIHQATLHLEEVSRSTNQSLRKLYKDIEFLYRNTYNIREITNKFKVADTAPEKSQ